MKKRSLKEVLLSELLVDGTRASELRDAVALLDKANERIRTGWMLVPGDPNVANVDPELVKELKAVYSELANCTDRLQIALDSVTD